MLKSLALVVPVLLFQGLAFPQDPSQLVQRMVRNELAEARIAMAEAENQVNQREAEIDELRRSAVSLQHQAASLRDELTAARQVGRSLLAALGRVPSWQGPPTNQSGRAGAEAIW